MHERTDFKVIEVCVVERWEGGRLAERVEFHDSYNMSALNNARAYVTEQKRLRDEAGKGTA